MANTDRAALERDDNPCALVMLAHRIAQETRHGPQRRAAAKFGLLRDLYRRGYPQGEIERRYVIVDWLLRLPEGLERSTWQDIQAFKEEQILHYVTSAERFAREEALSEGRAEGLIEGIRTLLNVRFGSDGTALLPEIQRIDDPAHLQALLGGIADAQTLDEVRALLAAEQG